MKKKLVVFMMAAAMAATGAATVQAAEGNVNAFVGNNVFDGSLDPVKGAMSYAYPFINNALLKVNPDSVYVGDLATEWTISEDALTYTFKLRKGVKFSDGSDFTAEDVVFTYNEVLANPANNENVDLTRLESVTAVDDYTVEFKLKKAYSPFFDTVAMLQIVPSDAYDSETFNTMPIGTGAYKILQYDTNQQIILEANENYFGEAPAIDRVTLLYMDSDAAFAAAQSGQLDIVMVGTRYANEEIEGMSLQRFETMDVRNINLPVLPSGTATDINGNEVPVGNDVTCDKAVREALSIGLDRQNIINNAFNGIGKPSVNFTDNLVWASTEDYEDARREEAAAILEEAGWVDTDGDGIREKNGLVCSFDIYSPGADNDRYQLAVAAAEDAKVLGIDIQVKTASWDEVVTLENTSGIVWGWGQYSPTVLNALYNSKLFLDGGYDNVSGLQSEEVDAKIAEAIGAKNQEEAIAAWKEVQALADAEYPNLYLVNIEHCYFISDALDISMDTQVPHPHGHGSPIICNMADWKLAE